MITAPFVTLELRVERDVHINARDEIATMAVEWGLASRVAEEMWLIAMDHDRKVRGVTQVGKGGFNDVHIGIPFVLTSCLLLGSSRFVLIHNHPSGDPDPSQEDIALTKSVLAAAKTCDMWFEDSLIVSPDGRWRSMAFMGYM